MPPRATKRARHTLPSDSRSRSPDPTPTSLPAASSSRSRASAHRKSNGAAYDHDNDNDDDNGEVNEEYHHHHHHHDEPEASASASASHLVSFLTGYADRHSSGGSSSGDERDHDRDGYGFELPSEEEDEEDLDLDDDDDREGEDGGGGGGAGGLSTPSKRFKSGLVGTSTPRKTTPRKQRTGPGSKGNTPRKTPRKTAKDRLEELEKNESEGIIRFSRSDRYFVNTSRPSKTSGNSYSALAQPLSQAQYDKYTALSSGIRETIRPSDFAKQRYDQWIAELDAGFGLLFYGFGSKRSTINRFVRERLGALGNVVVINGHFPQLSIRDVLSNIEDSLSIPQDIPIPPSSNATPLDRSAHRIYSYFQAPPPPAASSSSSSSKSKSPRKKDSKVHHPPSFPHAISEKDLYLVIHNIDSPSLRSPRSLNILSLLSSSARIKIVATFDHLHTPLLFSPALNNTPPHDSLLNPNPSSHSAHTSTPPGRGFNWLYHNLTTYAPYDLELSYLRLSASSHLSLSSSNANGSGISEEGALQILKSVPPMAARLLKLLLVKQLANLPSDPKYHTAYHLSSHNQVSPLFAVDNDILMAGAKEKFIAREEERYDALIGEYRDHGLVVEALLDGEGRTGRWVWVPLGKAAIERILETMSGVEV
ncbi:hypothetical protein IAU59_000845 [Kwoniella sp. CBS 9459]